MDRAYAYFKDSFGYAGLNGKNGNFKVYLNSNEYLKVSPLLNPQELELVKEKIRRHKHRTLKRIGSREKRERQWEKNGVAALSQLKEFTNYATQLLEDFRVLNLDSSMDLGIDRKSVV